MEELTTTGLGQLVEFDGTAVLARSDELLGLVGRSLGRHPI